MTELALEQRDIRLDALRAASTVNAIDTVEVISVNQRTLRLTFVHSLPGELGGVPATPLLEAGNFYIEGGIRIKNIQVDTLVAADNELTITVDRAGDYSTYTLHLVNSPFDTETTPPGFDPLLSSIQFRFKINCPSDLDCVSPGDLETPQYPEPSIDYLSKDYQGFRRQILERLSVIMPAYTERSPADMQMMLVELLAYTGDQLSYYQDAVATEAYLGTARKRSSLRRHTRLLDYAVHQGCNARTWVRFSVQAGGGADNTTLPAGTPVLTGSAVEAVIVAPPATEESLRNDVVWFETLHDQRLHASHNEIDFYTWSGAVHCLTQGTTSVSLRNDLVLHLQVGDVLVFEQLRGLSGAEEDADPLLRWPVRLTEVQPTNDPLTGDALLNISWDIVDAMPFDLCLESEVVVGGVPQVLPISVARGNVLLADHGRQVRGNDSQPGLLPNSPQEVGQYHPRLEERDISFTENFEHSAAIALPASGMLIQDPTKALATVSATDADSHWTVQRDLLASDRFATDFVVEVENDSTAFLRFGDDVLGKEPSSAQSFVANYRVGNGPPGNIGAQSLRRVVTEFEGINAVSNPLAAVGGQDPETPEEIRRYAPQAFRTQKRAVTTDDWAVVTENFPQVQQAHAAFRWTGSWYTVFITVDRLGGLPVLSDAEFLRGLLDYLDQFRIAGYDLEIREPVFVPLDIKLRICLKPGYYAADIKAQLMEAFSAVDLHDGARGLFHPDNFSFGQTLYVSSLYALALSFDGVASVEVLRLQRWGKLADGEIAAGLLAMADEEILRCDSNPSLPENGAIDFEVLGES
ncbi:MAG: putative baseplate assembly protein [Gammaproteobacteria bacterium]|nr:putative baseplate assembly protein [Gammaproteobacteria bacterium]